MAKLRRNYTGNSLPTTTSSSIAASGTTSFTITAYTGWPSGSAPFYVVVEPGTANEEKMLVVRSGATDSTLNVYSSPSVAANRGLDGTTAVAHANGSAIYPVFTATDADEANEIAATLTTKGDLLTHGTSTFTRVGVGANDTLLVADSAQTAGIKWGQVQTAGIADDAVTSAKIANNAVGTTEIADSSVTSAKIAAGVIAAAVPTGAITQYAGSSQSPAPTGFLFCDGSVQNQTTYAALYAVVGATYNTGGEGAGNFRLPNLKGVVPVGRDESQTEFNTLGETGGAKTVTLTAAESGLPAHSHANTVSASAVADHTHSLSHGHTASSASAGAHSHDIPTRPDDATSTGGYYPTAEQTQQAVQTSPTAEAGLHSHTISVNNATGNTGAGGAFTPTVSITNANNTAAAASSAHQNLQPYIVLNYIIKT